MKGKLLSKSPLIFGLLGIVILAVYWPSLQHSPRADQLLYFILVQGKKTLKELILDSYALNRLPPHGDRILFRPLLYALLGLEKWMFGLHFWAWQAFNLTLHWIVTCQLFSILKMFSRWESPIPFFLSLLFAISTGLVEMVTWQHLSAYLLFCNLMLHCISTAFKIDSGLISTKIPWLLLTTVFISQFLYEFGIFLSFILGAHFLWLSRRKGEILKSTGWLLLVFPVIYLGLSTTDLFYRHGGWDAAKQIKGALSFIPMAQKMGNVIAFWLTLCLAPWTMQIISDARIVVHPSELSRSVIGIQAATVCLLIPAVLWIWRNLTSVQKWKASVLATLIMAFVYMIIIGRINDRGLVPTLRNNIYYAYPFFLLFVMLLGTCLWRGMTHANHLEIVVFLLFFAAQGASTLQVNIQTKRYCQPRLEMLQNAESIYRAHWREANFSFSNDATCTANDELPWTMIFSKNGRPYNILGAIYGDFYSREKGKYLLSCNH